MPVKRAEADAGLLGDLAHRRVDARGGEHRLGRQQQRIEAALGVGAHAAIRGAGGRRVVVVFQTVGHVLHLEKQIVFRAW